MKNKLMKISALLMVLIMALSLLAACGGSGSSSESGGGEAAEKAAAAEPNDGVQGIVYTVPEGWVKTGCEKGYYSTFEKEGSDFVFNVSATNEEKIKEWGDEEIKNMTIEEYFKKNYSRDDEWVKENNVEVKEIKICDVDAIQGARKTDKGVVSIGADWFFNDVIYSVGIRNKNTEYGEKGKIINDPEGASEQDLADYEFLIASIKPGDGSSLEKIELQVDTVGDFTFEKPEGYIVTTGADSFVDLEKTDSDIKIQINKTIESDFENWSGEDIPKTLKEYYEGGLGEDAEKTEIAGYEGYYTIYHEENGETYNARAVFMTEDAVYEGHIDAAEDMWGDEGIKDGIKPLTDEDIADFKALMSSLKKK